jgi:hypothetical protein
MKDSRRRIIPKPRHIEFGTETVTLQLNSTLKVAANVSDDVIDLMGHLWHSFSFNQGTLEVIKDESLVDFSFQMGNCTLPEVCDGDLYEVKADCSGVAGCGRNEQAFLYSYYSFLQMINSNNDTLTISHLLVPDFEIHDTPEIAFRGIHICVFPETTLEQLERYLKTSAFLKFSHIIVEFWGMLKYDCLDELSWPQAFTKEQIRPLLKEVATMGVELIPMFNHWGHAAGARECIGRHVVLSQNPKLAPLFEYDGWTWCLSNPNVRTLLKKVRNELLELFSDASIQYFCLGGDEARTHGECDNCSNIDKAELLAEFYNSVNDDLKQLNIRPIIWGDPLLDKAEFSSYIATGYTGGTPGALDMLSRDFIIADWQYDLQKNENDTFRYFKEKGFDVFPAPWNDCENIKSLCNSTRELNLPGVLFTTWNIFDQVLLIRCCLFSWQSDLRDYDYPYTGVNMIAQKLIGHEQPYEFAGWFAKEYYITNR